MRDKVALDFVAISRRLKQLVLPEVDGVVGIGSGGVVPAALIAYELERPLLILPINYRAPDNIPRHDAPVLLRDTAVPPEWQHVLLVDDVSVSGKTMAFAKKQMIGRTITTLAMKGRADYVLFPEIDVCVRWPWKV